VTTVANLDDVLIFVKVAQFETIGQGEAGPFSACA